MTARTPASGLVNSHVLLERLGNRPAFDAQSDACEVPGFFGPNPHWKTALGWASIE